MTVLLPESSGSNSFPPHQNVRLGWFLNRKAADSAPSRKFGRSILEKLRLLRNSCHASMPYLSQSS